MESIGGVGGIKCTECGYEDNTVTFEDFGEWLNKPCPDCGKNLLTEKEYKFAKAVMNVTAFLSLPVIRHIVIFINFVFAGGKKGCGTLEENSEGKIKVKDLEIY